MIRIPLSWMQIFLLSIFITNVYRLVLYHNYAQGHKLYSEQFYEICSSKLKEIHNTLTEKTLLVHVNPNPPVIRDHFEIQSPHLYPLNLNLSKILTITKTYYLGHLL